jgi:hypothetical protein
MRLCIALIAVALAACGRTQDTESPVATPTVTLARGDAVIGTPVEMRYRFVVAPDAPAFAEDYLVFVHFLDTDGELMWTDDHQPATPVSQWKPGQTIEYARTMFVPKFPYVGETRVELGMYSPKSGVRVPLKGETKGQRSYQVATFSLKRQTDSLYVVFKDGWHETEVSPEEAGVDWQWSKKTATLAFRNPMRDATFYLQCDQPVLVFTDPQHVELRIGANVFDSFILTPGHKELRKVDLSKAQLGDAETVEVTVAVDKTFVPASITQLKSTDSRDLGIRVFRAYVQAK